MANITKVTAEGWIEAAKSALIKEGISGVKVDRLAKKLGVTRGGFYHNFKNQKDLLDKLLRHWGQTNNMLPEFSNLNTPADAVKALDQLTTRTILEENYSSAFDTAVREWARVDKRARTMVDAVDESRINTLEKVFAALGCDAAEAKIRARVFYYHQIGFYALGHQKTQTKEERLARRPIYMQILCGKRFLEAVEAGSRKWV